MSATARTTQTTEPMTFACARALRICALLAMPGAAVAQSTRAPTIFSPTSQVGTVTVRAAVVLADYSVKPLPLLKVVARRGEDSVTAQTDLDGRVTMTLPAGRYTLRAKTAQPVAGRTYAWNLSVVVRPARNEALQLTNENASMSDSVSAVVASSTPAPTAPATPAPSARANTPSPTKPSPAKQPVTSPAKQSVTPPAKQPVTPPSKQPVTPPSKPAADRPAPPVERHAVVADTTRRAQPAPTPAPPALPVPRLSMQSAPRTNTSKLLLGLSASGSALRSDGLNSSTESGAGLAGQLGWGFTKNFAIVIDASAARIESVAGKYDLAHVDIGGRWHFVSSSHGFVPFVEVGYSGRAMAQNDVLMADEIGNTYAGDLTLLGGGISFGGGLQYFITQKWALGGAFKWTTGSFTRVQIDDMSLDGFAIDAASARFNMGFTWFPMGRSR